MRGVLLINMGGPNSPEELKQFLSRMFMDPKILPYNKLVRHLLSFVISRLRYKKSWLKYEQIGGTPLVKSTIKTTKALQQLLGEEYLVKYAFSYSSPGIGEVLDEFKEERIREITIIPLYPQSSYTTTSSVKDEVQKIGRKDQFFTLKFQEEFYTNPGFIEFWTTNITMHLEEYQIKNPTLVFSAHAIPEYHINNGDTYATAIVNSAALIAHQLGFHYEAAFQSGMRRGKWIGPAVKEHLKIMAEEGIDNVVLIPISFVHENLETKYDLDAELIPYAKNVLGFKEISRVQLPEADPLLVALLANLVHKI